MPIHADGRSHSYAELPNTRANHLPVVLNENLWSQETRRGVGARCGGRYTKLCDTGAGELYCFENSILDPSGIEPLFFTLGVDEGFCVESCDPTVPSCPATSDPGTGPAQCLNMGTGTQGALGICSHECNALTDPDLSTVVVNRCTGLGGEGVGRNCFALPSLTINQTQGIFAQADICLDVLAPPHAEASIEVIMDPINPMGFNPSPSMGTTPPDCLGSGDNGQIFQCPTNTVCSNVGTQRIPIPACVRRCTTPYTVAQQPYVTSECSDSTLPNAMNLVCVPFAKTSTTPHVGTWFGFCAPAPN